MGFFGLFFLARSAQPLAELTSVRSLHNSADLHESAYADGWRLGQVFQSGDTFDDQTDLAKALLLETDAPVLTMYVVDSDYGLADIMSPGGVRHWFYLDFQSALSHFEEWDEYDPQPPAEETVAHLMRWAAEAGLTPAVDALPAAIEESPGPFGEGVVGLIAALGIEENRDE